MSEYWVSHKKYFCKYCEVYIADDAPSRRQHETGLRHKGNTERFVRSLYKQGERKKDLEEEKREMARVEQAAGEAFARDISSGHASVASSSSRLSQPAPSASTSKKPEKPASVWSNYSTAQSLGYTDPDEERRQAEIERRRLQGAVGEWQTVAPPPPPLPGAERDVKEEESKEGILPETMPRKREAEPSIEDDEDGRRFKLRRRTVAAGLGEIWDPGDIPIKLKPKAKEQPLDLVNSGGISSSVGSREGESLSNATSKAAQDSAGETPKWKPMGWKRPATDEDSNQADIKKGADDHHKAVQEGDPALDCDPIFASVKSEEVPWQGLPVHVGGRVGDAVLGNHEVKEEEIPPSKPSEQTGSMFRKRKIPASGRGRR